MKRQLHSPSPSSPLSNSQISDELEPIPKRPRIFVSSPTPPPDNANEIDEIDDDGEEEVEEENDNDEIIIDDPITPSVTINENSQNEHIDDEDDDDDDIIEIEQQIFILSPQGTDDAIIVVSDSELDDSSSDDQGIDVTDDTPPSVSSIIHESISSPDIEDIEIVHEEVEGELAIMDDEEVYDDDDGDIDDEEEDPESLEIVNNDNELIDLTDDEPISISCSPTLSERKLSTDVQQCPICLETLSHLQRSGVYLIITRCRHVMCTLCSRQLLATSSRCPLCRENVSSATLMPYCILT